jgi:hypothetical protein
MNNTITTPFRSYTGVAIALAWPDTYCKQAGAWYDPIMNLAGIAKNNYYKVGHAALVLINKLDGNCYYYDFGRYHAPFGSGRVRSAYTDHDLAIPLQAVFGESGQLLNLDEIMLFLTANSACHGTGAVHAGCCELNFEKSKKVAINMQLRSPITYGPFVWQGTNCSRFVRSVLLAGRPGLFTYLRLLIPDTISPTPLANVRAVGKIGSWSPCLSLSYAG